MVTQRDEAIASYGVFSEELRRFHSDHEKWDVLGAEFKKGDERFRFADKITKCYDAQISCAHNMNKLFATPLQIAFLGTFSAGKSSVINAIVNCISPETAAPRTGPARTYR
jgi:hypothetical protein